MSELRESSYLVRTTRLRDLFQQERAQPARVGSDDEEEEEAEESESEESDEAEESEEEGTRGSFIERAFRSDIDVTTPDQLVSLGFTWSKVVEIIRNGGVLWMGQDTYLRKDHLDYEIAPRGFRQLVMVSTQHESELDFDITLFGTDPESGSHGCMMNILTEIISLDESVTDLWISNGGGEPRSVLHCPPTALERFITKPARKRRVLRFAWNLRISNEQSQVLYNNGSISGNIKLQADFAALEDGGAILMEAIRSNRCPGVLSFSNFQVMSETTFVEFIGALGSNESLKEIDIKGFTSDERMAVLLPTLTANNRLISLCLLLSILNNDLWRRLWSLMAHNTSIHHLDVRATGLRGLSDDVKVQRDKCIVEALKRNTVLTDIIYSGDEHDTQIMREAVLPMLEVNRFRPRIQAIRQVPIDAVRRGLFGKALLQPQFQQNPFLLFRLLLVHSDDLATLLKSAIAAESSIARRVKRRRRLVASK